MTTVYDPANLHGMPTKAGPLPAGLPAPPGDLTPPPKGPAKPTSEQDPGDPATGDPIARVANGYWERTEWELDRRARPLVERAPDGGRRVWTRNPDTYVKSFADEVAVPGGVQVRHTKYERDGKGYVTLETLPDQNTRKYEYAHPLHQLTLFTDERNNWTLHSYNAGGRLFNTVDDYGVLFDGTWADGLLQEATDARGVTTSYGYDSNRRQTVAIEAFNDPQFQRTVTTAYDPTTGEVEKVEWSQGYDATPNRPVIATTYAYDLDARLTSTTD